MKKTAITPHGHLAPLHRTSFIFYYKKNGRGLSYDFKSNVMTFFSCDYLAWINKVIFKLYWTENSTVIEGDCEVSLRSSSQQPPVIYVKCDRLQPWIEPVTQDLSPARGTARPCCWQRLRHDASKLKLWLILTSFLYIVDMYFAIHCSCKTSSAFSTVSLFCRSCFY